MNKLRKIIALMLSLSVIFTAAISVFSAENFDDDGNRDNDAGLSDEEQNVLIQDSHPKHELDNPDDADVYKRQALYCVLNRKKVQIKMNSVQISRNVSLKDFVSHSMSTARNGNSINLG